MRLPGSKTKVLLDFWDYNNTIESMLWRIPNFYKTMTSVETNHV